MIISFCERSVFVLQKVNNAFYCEDVTFFPFCVGIWGYDAGNFNHLLMNTLAFENAGIKIAVHVCDGNKHAVYRAVRMQTFSSSVYKRTHDRRHSVIKFQFSTKNLSIRISSFSWIWALPLWEIPYRSHGIRYLPRTYALQDIHACVKHSPIRLGLRIRKDKVLGMHFKWWINGILCERSY